MKITKKHGINIFLILIFSSLLTLLAFWHGNFPLTYDGKIYLGRIQQVYESLVSHHLPPMINFIGQDHNLGAMTAMYPWLSSLIFIVPMFILKNGFYSFLIGFIILNFITGVNFYIFSCFLSRKKIYALLGSIIYLFNSYHIEELFVRNALGEAISYAFFPIIALGLFQIWEENKKGIFILALGMIGIANSHILSLYFVILMIILLELFRLVRKKLTLKEVNYFLKSILLTLLGSMYMIYQFCSILFKNKNMTMASRFFNYISPTISFNEMINNHLKVLYNSWNIGMISCGLLFFFLLKVLEKQKMEKWGIATWIALVSALFSFGLFHLPNGLFSTFQFAGRIYCLTVFCISFATVTYFSKYNLSIINIFMLIGLSIVMGSAAILNYKTNPIITDQAEITSSFNKNNYFSMYYNSGCKDYTLPYTKGKYKENSIKWEKSTSNSATYKVESNKGGKILLPVSAFKNIKYNIYVNSKEVKVSKIQNRFLIHVNKGSNTVTINAYANTLSYITFFLSVISIVCILLISMLKGRKLYRIA